MRYFVTATAIIFFVFGFAVGTLFSRSKQPTGIRAQLIYHYDRVVHSRDAFEAEPTWESCWSLVRAMGDLRAQGRVYLEEVGQPPPYTIDKYEHEEIYDRLRVLADTQDRRQITERYAETLRQLPWVDWQSVDPVMNL